MVAKMACRIYHVKAHAPQKGNPNQFLQFLSDRPLRRLDALESIRDRWNPRYGVGAETEVKMKAIGTTDNAGVILARLGAILIEITCCIYRLMKVNAPQKNKTAFLI